MLAINDLKNINLQRDLMARRMNWTEFTEILEFRAVASQAVQILDGNTESAVAFKKKVGVVTNITKRSSYSACDCCNHSSSHSIN